MASSRLLRYAVASCSAATLAAVSLTRAECSAAASSDSPKVALSKSEFRDFTVLMTKKLSHDTSLVRFTLPSTEHTLGLTTASCLSISATVGGQKVGRPYTPISTTGQKGTADFVIKGYPARTDGQPGGMGNHLRSLKAGDTVQMKGPWKKFGYTAGKYAAIGMIAGGTGLTPMLQVIQEALYDPCDSTKITLLYANRSERDILLRDRLDALAALYPNRFSVVYALDSADAGWKGERGFVTPAMIKKHLPPVDATTKIFVCGPPPMMNAVSGNKAKDKKQGELSGALKSAGYTKSHVFKF